MLASLMEASSNQMIGALFVLMGLAELVFGLVLYRTLNRSDDPAKRRRMDILAAIAGFGVFLLLLGGYLLLLS